MNIRLPNRTIVFGLCSWLIGCSTFILFSTGILLAQDPYAVKQYDFIQYDKNKLEFYGDSLAFESLYRKIDRMMFQGLGQVRVVHIGGSHIQADIFSDRMRHRLSGFFPGNLGSRGFIFPFKMARTNNPYNYLPEFTGKWSYCKNIQKTKPCTLGLAGMSVTTKDTSSSIKISFRGTSSVYDFTRVRVFHDMSETSYSILSVVPDTFPDVKIDSALGYTEFTFDNPTNNFQIEIIKTDSVQDHFTLYGFDMSSEDAGFYYDAIGVNGADVPSYLRCSLFEEHIAAVDPDLVVLSIGINDAYKVEFDPAKYERHYDSLVAMIRRGAPNTAILFTTNNDSYYKRRYVNKHVFKVVERMQSLSKKYGAGVWDMFEVMGGLNSIVQWQKRGLAKPDKIHFTPDGYRLIGDLMFNAFMRSYDNYLRRNSKGGQR